MTIEEPNNTVAEALDTELTSANPGSFLETGIIDSPDDVDFLSFQLNEGDRAIVDIDAEIDDSELDSLLRIFDSAGNTDDVLVYSPPENFRGVDEFEYTIADEFGNTDFAFVDIQTDEEGNTNILLVDRNNATPAVENPVDDITLEQGETPSAINLFDVFEDAEEEDADLTYRVANTNTSLVETNFNPETGELTLILSSGVGSSDLILEASDSRGFTGSERFTLTKAGSEQEPNDTISQATNIGASLADAGEFATSGFIGDNTALDNPRLDTDLYQVSLNSGESIQIDVDTNAEVPLDTILRVFNIIGRELGFNDDRALQGEKPSADPSLEFSAPNSGNFYIGISSAANDLYSPFFAESGLGSGVTGTYQLTVTQNQQPQPGQENAESPVNDTLDNATRLDLGEAAIAQTGEIGDNPDFITVPGLDVDLYQVELAEAQTVSFSITRASVDALLRVFDSNGAEIAFNDDLGDQESFIEFEAPTAGTYYIGVSGFGNRNYDPNTAGSGNNPFADTGSYTLNVTPEMEQDDFTDTEINTPVTIDVLANDFEFNGLENFDETSTEGGTITLDDQETPTDNTDDVLVYTPPENFRGVDLFSYTAIDEEGNTADAFVEVEVGEPIFTEPDFTQTDINTPITIDVLANDINDFVVGLDSFEETSFEGGTITLDDNGTPEDNTDDVLVYSPPENFRGVDEFEYTIADEFGNTDFAFVEVEVGEPIFPEPDFTQTEINTDVTIDVLANDFDDFVVGLDSFEETSFEGGTITLDDKGTPEDNTDDALVYTPPADFVGFDFFEYTIADEFGNTDFAFVDVQVGIIAEDDSVQTAVNNQAIVDVLANDSSFDAIESFEETSAEGGTVTLDENGTPEDNTDDALVYTPPADFVGFDFFEYTIADELGNTASAFVDIQVGVFAEDDFAETNVNTEVTIDVLANDFNFSQLESFEETSFEGGTVTLDDNGTPEDNTDDALVYTPPTDLRGDDFFEYTITDELGNRSIAFVDILVGVTDRDDFTDTEINTPVTIDVLANDFEFNGLENFDETSTEGGTITLDDQETPTDNTDDVLVYTPPENFRGVDLFSYTAIDEEGNTADAFVDVEVGEPIFPELDFTQTDINTDVTIDVLANDFDDFVVGLDSFEETSFEGGTVTLDDKGTPEDNTDDALVYTPPADFVGFDFFEYTIADEFGNTASTFVDVEVGLGTPEDDFAEDDFANTEVNTEVTINVLENDIGFGFGFLFLDSFDEISDEGGTITLDNNGTPETPEDDALVYTPPTDFEGVDFFEYTAIDEFGDIGFGLVEVEVGDSTLPPLSQADDLIFGSLENDVLNAVDGDNPYSGDNQIAFLGEGEDTVDGTDAVGNNRLYTSLGDDSIIAAVGDRIFTEEGNDEILIQGDNYAFASEGDDTIDARLSLEGSNRLYGQAGNDDLFASVNDVLFGGEGNDRLFVGTESDNLLTGNAGEDQFWVATGEVPNGINSITDFSLGEDTIGINLSEEVSFDDLVILSDGNNTLIGFDAENPFVSLQGIDSTELSESDFTFAETTI